MSPSLYPFGSFADLEELAGSRPVALFGLGTVAAATLACLVRPPAYLVDIEVGLAGSRQSGVEIIDPSALCGLTGPRPYVVVCTAEIADAARSLDGLGFAPRRDYLISPMLSHERPVVELAACRARLLFTSGAPASDAADWGGGIYELEIDGDRSACRKVYDGPCYAVRELGEALVAVDPKRGLLVMDRRYRVTREISLPLTAWCHGLAFRPDRSRCYVAATQLDRVLVFDADFAPAGEILLSGAPGGGEDGAHHPNDLLAHGDGLFVSVFSRSGQRRLDVNDGAVLAIDPAQGRVVGPVVEDLWMPHSPAVVAGSLVVLDSFRGRLCRSGGRTVGQFPGFARGLAHDGRFFYVGQNRNRQYHRLPAGHPGHSLDTAIVIFDEGTQLYRSVPLPRALTDVHAILVLDPAG